MPSHASLTQPLRPLSRAFCPSHVAADALAQSYERLLPGARRPLPQPATAAPTPVPRPSRAVAG
jgi:hypothetical protein